MNPGRAEGDQMRLEGLGAKLIEFEFLSTGGGGGRPCGEEEGLFNLDLGENGILPPLVGGDWCESFVSSPSGD